MALELATEDPDYEDIAIQCYQPVPRHRQHHRRPRRQRQPAAVGPGGRASSRIWSICPDGQHAAHRRVLLGRADSAVRLRGGRPAPARPSAALRASCCASTGGGVFDGSTTSAHCPDWENDRGEHLLSLVDHTMLPRILTRLLRRGRVPVALRRAQRQPHPRRAPATSAMLPGIGQALIEYVPGESNSGLFGGNSNWRGPIWMPTNYTLVQALEKFHRFLGDDFTSRRCRAWTTGN
ncbi:MAG: hypothetical protein MZV63_19295 [Marinilabiliales bacterium]|nr:hypothetical protein [Marinilabiliales bacterium]